MTPPLLSTLARMRPGERVAAAVRRLWRAAARRVRIVWAAGRRAWRRSLQVRIVSITLIVSGALVGAFGYVVAQRITTGMLDSKVERSQQDADRGLLAQSGCRHGAVRTAADDDDIVLGFHAVILLSAIRPAKEPTCTRSGSKLP